MRCCHGNGLTIANGLCKIAELTMSEYFDDCFLVCYCVKFTHGVHAIQYVSEPINLYFAYIIMATNPLQYSYFGIVFGIGGNLDSPY